MLKVSRRRFAAGAGSLLAMPMIVPSGCVSACKVRRPLPSERIHVGMLGYGTMAQDNIGNFLHNERVQVIAVCDPVSEGPLYGYKAERMGGRDFVVRRGTFGATPPPEQLGSYDPAAAG